MTEKGGNIKSSESKINTKKNKCLSDNKCDCINSVVLSELLDSVSEGVVIVSPDGRISFANISFCRFTGIAINRVVGVDFIDLFRAVFGGESSRSLSDSLNICRNKVVECHALNCRKGHQTFKVKMSPLASASAQGVVEVVFTDISAQRRTQEKLSESRTLYQAVFDGAGDAVFVSNSSGRFIEVNRAACSNLGYSRDELLGLTASDIFSHKYCRRIPDQISTIERDGQSFFEVEYVRKDGTIFPAELSSRAIDFGGKKAFLTISRDISERKKSERNATMSRMRFKALYELSHMSDGSQEVLWEFTVNKSIEISSSRSGFICRVDGAGQDIRIARLYTCDGGQVVPVEASEIEADGILLKCIRTRKPVIMNNIIRKKALGMLPGSEYLPSRGLALPILDSGKVVAVLSVFDKEKTYSRRDIYNLNLLIEGMWQIVCKKESELKVRASLREKETLLREVHHRVKNNMQVISSLLNLQTEYIRDPEDLKLIRHSIERVRSMAYVHEHLYRSDDLSRINFASYIEYLGDRLFKAYGCGSKIRFVNSLDIVRLSIDQALPCGLIVNELITNAINHAFPDDFKDDQRFVKVILRCYEDTVELDVQDNGVGCSSEEGRGTLGLTLVETLVSQLGGNLSKDCMHGTRYQLTFPIK
ncbi:PAS domain S-box protein [Maridesulfovibrio bastinii]|uniref:PAS domain S-box protein n=1 Tax=Maridesulfovibrio bastinii TaxID=47157 RepID=UPI0003FF4A2F|nr:PAS domain S-box protein [Maridesulfovibrio bastinii]